MPDLSREIRISTEIACVGCGHLLVGQVTNSICPECAQPVRWSLYGSTLNAADVAWLQRRYLGASIAIVILPWAWAPPAWLAGMVAVWLLTSPNPAHAHVASVGAWTLRISTIAAYTTLAAAGTYALMVLVRFAEEFALLSAAAYFLSQAVLTFAIWNIVREDRRRAVSVVRKLVQWGTPAILILLITLTIYSVTSTVIASGGSVPTWLLTVIDRLLPLVGIICGLMSVIAIPGFWALLAVARRQLDQAIIRSNDIRQRVRAWNPWTSGEERAPAASLNIRQSAVLDSPPAAV